MRLVKGAMREDGKKCLPGGGSGDEVHDCSQLPWSVYGREGGGEFQKYCWVGVHTHQCNKRDTNWYNEKVMGRFNSCLHVCVSGQGETIFHITFKDNYKKELKTLCSTYVIQLDKKLTFIPFLREWSVVVRFTCALMLTQKKKRGSARREGYSLELSGKAITIALFASLGHAHYFIRVASTTMKDWRLDDGWGKAEALLDKAKALFCVLIRIICPL